MRVYLMQHGKPVPEKENPDRPLSEQGTRDVVKSGVRIEKVFHSTKTGARQKMGWHSEGLLKIPPHCYESVILEEKSSIRSHCHSLHGLCE